MLRYIRYVLSIIVVASAAYELLAKNFEFHHYIMFFLGLTMLVLGIEEYQRNKKGIGLLLVGVFLFLMVASVQGFLLH
ncbi:DUF3953 domain-containing protein [Falsibacillus albus]|uniref:DUF3953 domain-containing protein n=1 Tax=Falsibacillus albus TaxID=2478915 RepID=A0A3L7JTR1_9BACI|nr:DUF3953 domain-containing protein [Falsibacillus albus]RLQ93665.1 DUF3953 domain-containing protein [Falsibacillus albus]